jgi:hypothetical protein
MKKDVFKKRVTKVIKFSKFSGDNGEFLGGGVLTNTSHIENEMWVEVFGCSQEPVNASEINPESGSMQIHIGSSSEALKELGYFLIRMSMFDSNNEDFSLEFDLENRESTPELQLIIHVPTSNTSSRPKFPIIHTVGKRII